MARCSLFLKPHEGRWTWVTRWCCWFFLRPLLAGWLHRIKSWMISRKVDWRRCQVLLRVAGWEMCLLEFFIPLKYHKCFSLRLKAKLYFVPFYNASEVPSCEDGERRILGSIVLYCVQCFVQAVIRLWDNQTIGIGRSRDAACNAKRFCCFLMRSGIGGTPTALWRHNSYFL